MVFTVSLYASLIIFLIGLVYKVSTWFSRTIGISNKDFTASERFFAAVRGIAGTVFSGKILTLIRSFVLDVLLQKKILQEDLLRWAMHMLIYVGFTLLLLMHALGEIITSSLFSEYYSTINPFFFLRDFFGLMVVAGIAIAVYRRFILKVPRMNTNGMDHYVLIILAVIMISGVFLEGVKITSRSDFVRMVEEFSDIDGDEDLAALESLWVEEFGLVSGEMQGPFEEDVLEQGRELHEMNCVGCHSAPQWAFAGYGAAKLMGPMAPALDRGGMVGLLWYIHIMACLVGLAYLPFSKMFHVIATPLSLLANSVMDGTSDPANVATRQAMELDACMHCGTCSLRCSAAAAFDAFGNERILPAEKMRALKHLADGTVLTPGQFDAIKEGIYLCTNCDRCTVVCPAGINLRELWVNVREDLVHQGSPAPFVLSPYSFFRGLNRDTLARYDYAAPVERARNAVSGRFRELMDPSKPISLPGSGNGAPADLPNKTFAFCFGCQNCTTVCPVVSNYDNPEEILGLLPHQIMCSLGLGLTEMASGSRMIWDCVTCYQCQEHCPQNVKVTDIFFELKNKAFKNALASPGVPAAGRESV